MKKKILIGLGILILFIFGLLITAPFLFKGKIQEMVLKTINDNMNANIAIESFDLSLLKSFPQATVTINGLSIINQAPFEGDTLMYLGKTELRLSVKELFKGKDETLEISSFDVFNSQIFIKFNKDGIGNFDIALKEEEEDLEDDMKTSLFSMQVQRYGIENMTLVYEDAVSNTKAIIANLNHEGTGDFSGSKLDLETHSEALISFDMDNTNYLNQVNMRLDAILGLDLENSIFTFKENKALIQQLPLKFEGSIQLLEEGQKIQLRFETPTSDFTNFLGLIPSAYNEGLDKIKTTGTFAVKGKVEGIYSENTIPTFLLDLQSKNASFMFPDLPKAVEQIVINTQIFNETGLVKDIVVDIKEFSFKIDQDVFNAQAKVTNLVENAFVDAGLKGIVNLGNLSKAYPMKLDFPLSGVLKADITTQFDMLAVEKEQYQNVKNTGTMHLSNFNYTDETGKAICIHETKVTFNPSTLLINKFEATIGKSDLQATGILDNFYGYLFNDQKLKGNFKMTSNQLLVSDFLTTETAKPTKSGEETKTEPVKTANTGMKIPAFLDCTITAKAKSVIYDNLNLQDVSGKMIIKDEKVTLSQMKTSIFEGQINFDGHVSTKTATPTFDMNLGLNKIDIPLAFTQLEMLGKIAPIANVVMGRMNANIQLKGSLDALEMTPNLNTLSGDLFGQLLEASIKSGNSKMLTALDGSIPFLDLSKLNVNNLKTSLTFADGKVNIKPFDIKYQDLKLQIGGTHGFDQKVNYNLTLDVPIQYLGTEVNNLLAKLSPADAKKIESMPVSGRITGTFEQPKVSTDMKQATTQLVNQLVAQQKQALINKGTNALGNLINKNNADTTKIKIPITQEEAKEQVKEKAKNEVKNRLNNLLKKNN